ncbi:uncharacterized protein LOC130666530 [Microplitis mediator]|uniref:uncharacterized protein LOC130666530 n=1 Tax=Microplitis mediator TaxID=375433 RepID=UPI0025553EE8|nr:uncharacterized protein LOC130666530 [Microplitis mediator]XP_057323618.1 uncharacterized protein LOC130666530 [Microplitis mediator]
MQELRKKQLSRIDDIHFLIQAIKFQDEDYIDNVTNEDICGSINTHYGNYGPPLHLAARVGNYKIFQKLIKIGADIHQRNSITQETVLDSAMESFNYDIVKYLKENGVEKSDGIEGETALPQFAADEGTREVMMLLVTNKADINAKSDDGIILFINAAKAKQYGIMNAVLIKYILDLFCIYEGDDDTKTIFHAAAGINNYTALMNWLIRFCRKHNFPRNDNFFSYFIFQMGYHNHYSRLHMLENAWPELFPEGIDVNAADSIKRHIEELIAAGLYVCKENIEVVSNTKRLDDYSAECLSEVEKMKKNVIEGSNITFIEILHKNVRYLGRYLKNVDLNKIFIREPQFPEYPIYETKIFFKLWKAQIRVNYVKYSEEVLSNIFYKLRLPDTFVRELYIYLSNDDLKKIVQPSKWTKK